MKSIKVTRDIVALILAIGLCTALNLLVFAVAYDAIASAGPGLSENATQILTGWGGGIIGILGAVFGYQAGERAGGIRVSEPPEPPPIAEPIDEPEPPPYFP